MNRPLFAPFALAAPLALALGVPGCQRDPGPAQPGATSAAPRTVAASEKPDDEDADAGAAPSDEELCAMPPAQAQTLPAARSFVPSAVDFDADDPMSDIVAKPLDANDTCVVATSNLARAERESRVTSSSSTRSPPPDRSRASALPMYLDRLDAHLHLTSEEKATLQTNGFVVLDRLAYPSYASAFHDVFQEQLPLFVSADAAMHAVFRGDELVLERIERKKLLPALHTLLTRMRAGLRAARPRLAADTAHDLDVYLGVAAALADADRRNRDPDKPATPLTFFGHDDEVTALVGDVEAHEMTDPETGIELFGRARVIDFSQYEPRAHYADGYTPDLPSLSSYFQAMTWLSRLELNLVSRSCRSSQPGETADPAETPREAVDALALAEIAQESGAVAQIQQFEDVYRTFAGKREDVSIADLLALERRAHFRSLDPAAAVDLKRAIGDAFKRTARTHFMPAGSGELPAITTLIGVRVVPDIAPLTRLVEDSVAGRTELGAADVGYVLGHDRARAYLKDDLARYPELAAKLDAARAELRAGASGVDVYSGWLRTVLAVATPLPREAVVPSFVHTAAYQDRRLDSALVGFGQLRHAFTLLAGQGYDAYGCEIPDAYVEPVLPQWDALVEHVHQVHQVSGGFVGLERTLRMLRDIARTESTGAPLSEPQRRWLGMVAEYRDKESNGDSGAPPTWTGWYFDMFEDREKGASKNASFVADYFTLTNAGEVRYLGAETPRLGIFVVDVGGAPRALVGPVAKGYETSSGVDERLDDRKAVDHEPKLAPWRASFAPPAAPTPRLGLRGHFFSCGDGDHPAHEVRIALRARMPLGKVTVTVLDHHGDPLCPGILVDIGRTWQTVAVRLPGWSGEGASPVESIGVHVHDLSISGLGAGAFDASSRPGVYTSGDFSSEEPPPPPRWEGTADFVFGGPPGTPISSPRPPTPSFPE